MSRESTITRRDAILSAAGIAMADGRRRRARTARFTSAAAVLALAVATVSIFSQSSRTEDRLRPLAIDFQSIRHTTESVDFSIVRDSGVPLIDTLTDDEAEAALEEAGYCVRLLRTGTMTRLVDCSSGVPAVIR